MHLSVQPWTQERLGDWAQGCGGGDCGEDSRSGQIVLRPHNNWFCYTYYCCFLKTVIFKHVPLPFPDKRLLFIHLVLKRSFSPILFQHQKDEMKASSSELNLNSMKRPQ